MNSAPTIPRSNLKPPPLPKGRGLAVVPPADIEDVEDDMEVTAVAETPPEVLNAARSDIRELRVPRPAPPRPPSMPRPNEHVVQAIHPPPLPLAVAPAPRRPPQAAPELETSDAIRPRHVVFARARPGSSAGTSRPRRSDGRSKGSPTGGPGSPRSGDTPRSARTHLGRGPPSFLGVAVRVGLRRDEQRHLELAREPHHLIGLGLGDVAAVDAGSREIASVTRAANAMRSTASACPAGTAHPRAISSNNDPALRISSFNSHGAVFSLSDFSEFEHTSSAKSAV